MEGDNEVLQNNPDDEIGPSTVTLSRSEGSVAIGVEMLRRAQHDSAYGVIAVEDLMVNRMTHNHCLAKSIVDASWSAFFAQLDAKAEEAGRQFIKVNQTYTSQTCSQCGHRQKMPLSERIFDCPSCHAHLDRDLNASLNIRALGLQGLGLSLEAPRL